MPGERRRDPDRYGQFSLHVQAPIESAPREGREALERSCRHIARPPIQVERLPLAADGRFPVLGSADIGSTPELRIVLDWFAERRARVR